MSATTPQPDRQPFDHRAITDEQRVDLRRQLLSQRLTQLEAEHVQAAFAVEQIEKAIEQARVELGELRGGPQ